MSDAEQERISSLIDRLHQHGQVRVLVPGTERVFTILCNGMGRAGLSQGYKLKREMAWPLGYGCMTEGDGRPRTWRVMGYAELFAWIGSLWEAAG